ncbi:MAG: hypothetical protein KF856_09465 [Cyclobacteriaceae bacterium]|nr:hypothetical protein [Cyclobacteriaceae bacterium]
MKTRDELHKLIDKIEDESTINSYLALIKVLENKETGLLWNSLTEIEQQELLLSYHESFDTQNLVSHEQVKSQHSKWLEK